MNHDDLIKVARSHPEIPSEFAIWLEDNTVVWDAFCVEAVKAVRLGYQHYSSKTILEYLRHHSLIYDTYKSFKLNNNHTPYLSRLFAAVYPDYAGLFSYRTVRNAE